MRPAVHLPLQQASWRISTPCRIRRGDHESYFHILRFNVFAIRNDFFGETVTVSGLITGQDLKAQLLEKKASGTDLGDTLLITCNMLRSGEQVFLDDMTVQELEDALDMTLVAVENQGQELIEAMLNHHYTMQRDNDTDSFVYVKGYNS